MSKKKCIHDVHENGLEKKLVNSGAEDPAVTCRELLMAAILAVSAQWNNASPPPTIDNRRSIEQAYLTTQCLQL